MPRLKPTVELTCEQVELIAKAIADPRRYDILRKLAQKPCATPCSDMRDAFDITPATLSHHMKELEAAGLILSERNGKFVNYTPQPHILEAFFDRLRTDLT